MNQRNIEALEAAVGEVLEEAYDLHGVPPARKFAEHLASRGVLATSVLTDEQIDTLGRFFPEEYIDTAQPPPEYDRIREELDSIAKGEAA